MVAAPDALVLDGTKKPATGGTLKGGPAAKYAQIARGVVEARDRFASRYPQEYLQLCQLGVTVARSYMAGFLVSSVPQIVRLLLVQLTGTARQQATSARQLLKRVIRVLWRSTHSHLVLELVTLFGGFQGLLFMFSRLWRRRLRDEHKQSIIKQVGFVHRLYLTEEVAVQSSGAEGAGESAVAVGSVTAATIAETPLTRSSTVDTLDVGPAVPASQETPPASPPATPPAANMDEFIPTVAAALLSSAMCLPILTSAQRLDFGLFAGVRALDSICSFHHAAFQRLFGRHVPFGRLALRNMDTLAFVASVTEILYSWFYVPDALPRSYAAWISRMSGTEACIYELPRHARESLVGPHAGETPIGTALMDLCRRRGIEPTLGDPRNGFISCLVLHEGVVGCVNFWASKWLQSFSRSVRIYLPIHLLPILIFRGRSLVNASRWPDTVARLLLSTAQSAAFLSTFIVLAFAPICVVRNIVRDDRPIWGPLLGSFLPGWSLLIEKRKRRREFALYVIPRAIESLMYRTRAALLGRKANVSSRTLLQNSVLSYGGFESLMWVLGTSYFLTGTKVDPLAIRGNARRICAWFLAQDVGRVTPGSPDWTLTGLPSPRFPSLAAFSPSRAFTLAADRSVSEPNLSAKARGGSQCESLRVSRVNRVE